MNELERTIRGWMRNFETFTAKGGGVKLHRYQLEPAQAILESVRLNRGLDLVVIIMVALVEVQVQVQYIQEVTEVQGMMIVV